MYLFKHTINLLYSLFNKNAIQLTKKLSKIYIKRIQKNPLNKTYVFLIKKYTITTKNLYIQQFFTTKT